MSPAPRGVPHSRAGWLLPALCLWGTVGLGCGPSAADTRAATGQVQQELSGAAIERGYSGTLALVAVTRSRVELCTATLLTPNLAATARHCIAPTSADSVRCDQDPARFSEPYDTDSLWLNRERQLREPLGNYGLLPVTGGGDEFVPVAEVFVPDTTRVCGGDLALVLLAEELEPSDAEPIAPRLDAPAEHGEAYTAIGFGITPDPEEQGIRRSREGLQISCTPENCAGVAAVEDTEFRGGDGVCSGDSGGPAIDEEGRVIGIASRSVDCTGSVYSALGRWRDFVREVAALAAREGSYAEPDWLEEAPPEPEVEAEPELPVSTAPSSEQAPESDGEDGIEIVPTPVVTEPVVTSESGSGCSLRGASATARWQPLALLLGLALGQLARRRSRVSRSQPGC